MARILGVNAIVLFANDPATLAAKRAVIEAAI